MQSQPPSKLMARQNQRIHTPRIPFPYMDGKLSGCPGKKYHPCMVYIYLHLVDFYGKSRRIYSIMHGCCGGLGRVQLCRRFAKVPLNGCRTEISSWTWPNPLKAMMFLVVWKPMTSHDWEGWWYRIFFRFTPTWENDPIWRVYFSDGLKPATR